MNEWTSKRLHPDSIRIRIVVTDSIRDSNENFRFAGPYCGGMPFLHAVVNYIEYNVMCIVQNFYTAY